MVELRSGLRGWVGGFGLGLTAAFCVLLLTREAAAATHDWVAVGNVVVRAGSDPGTSCLSNAQVGATFRFDWTFDDTVADTNPDPDQGDYPSVSSWRMRITNAGMTDDFSGTQGDVTVGNATSDAYLIDGSGPTPSVPDCGASDAGVNMTLLDDTGTAFDDDGQPTFLLNIGDFQTGSTVGVGVNTPMGTLLVGCEISDFWMSGSPEAPFLPHEQMNLPDGSVVWRFTTTDGTPCTGFDDCWVDPPFTEGFIYETDGASRFTGILDFPTGFGQDFEVWTGGVLVGSFGPGESVDFSGEPGGGVVEFTIRGIAPRADAADPEAFPLNIALDTVPATFTMTSTEGLSLPALGPAALLVLGLAVAAAAGLLVQSRR